MPFPDSRSAQISGVTRLRIASRCEGDIPPPAWPEGALTSRRCLDVGFAIRSGADPTTVSSAVSNARAVQLAQRFSQSGEGVGQVRPKLDAPEITTGRFQVFAKRLAGLGETESGFMGRIA